MEILNLSANAIPDGAAVYMQGTPADSEVLVVKNCGPLDRSVTAVPMDRKEAAKFLADRAVIHSVADSLPPVDERVMWFDREWCMGKRLASDLDGKSWWQPEDYWDMVEIRPELFWMPLPAPPTVAETLGEKR